MFFKSKINYSAKKIVPTYSKVQQVPKLVKVEPPQNSNTNLQEFLKPVWKIKVEQVNFQEQIDLQKTNLITPEYVLNSGTTLDTSNVSYNQMNDTNLNAADKINLAKNIEQATNTIYQKQQAQKQVATAKQQATATVSNADKIKQLQQQIDTLKQGENK